MNKRLIAGVVAALFLAGCSAGGSSQRSAMLPEAPASTTLGSYIKHVVIVVQENRTFDNFFSGYPNADGATFGYTSNGTKVPLKEITFDGPDLPHAWRPASTSFDRGKMDGFNLQLLANGKPVGKLPYAHVKRSLIQPYWTMAQQYVLADRMFSTERSDSFPNHLALIASTTSLKPTQAVASNPQGHPWGCDAPQGSVTEVVSSKGVLSPGPFPCFTQFKTMADTLDAANVSWKFYTPRIDTGAGQVWLVFDAIDRVRHGPDWNRNVISPQTAILTDVAKGALPAVSWVIPDARYSDHAGLHSRLGPSWVASVVNAIGKSPDWKSTAIVVLWDDYGGWYDHVAPPQLDFRGLGMRVPCLIISPYAKKGYVSHTQYEFGSVLKFVEQAFGLPALGSLKFGSGYTDARANSLIDSFDFTQKPRPFRVIPAKQPASFFLSMPPSNLPVDDD
jgi:phospholipase C